MCNNLAHQAAPISAAGPLVTLTLDIQGAWFLLRTVHVALQRLDPSGQQAALARDVAQALTDACEAHEGRV